MSFTKEEIQNLSNLFLSSEDANTSLAFEIMGEQELPKQLLTEIFAVYKLTKDEELKEKAKTLLEKYGSDRVKRVMKWHLKLAHDGSPYGATEKTIAKNIDKYCDGKELNGSKMATAMYKKYGTGFNYLLNNVSNSERKKNLKIFITGKAFKLHNAALTKFPPELFELTELEEIDLTGNKIKTIPAKIKVFKNLKVLRLTGNNLKTINKGILGLKNLEELYLDKNLMVEFPGIVLDMTWLKKLDISSVTKFSTYHGINLPVEKVKQLTNLRAIGLANYGKETRSSFRYHTHYLNYPHLTWLEVPEGQTLDLDPFALAKTAYEKNGEGETFILKYSKDKELKEKVLSKYYDPKTKTMDFGISSTSFFREALQLQNLPEELTSFDIQHLNLSNTKIGLLASDFHTELKEKFGYANVDKQRTKVLQKLVHLKTLKMDRCGLCGLPNGLESLVQLEELSLKSNYIQKGIEELGKLTSLKRLNIWSAFSTSYRKTIKIPESFANLNQLEHIDFYFYQIDEDSYRKKLGELLPTGCEIRLS